MRELALALGFESADLVLAEIKAGGLDPYVALDKYVAWLVGRGLAPRTVLTFVSAVKGLFSSEDIVIDSTKLRNKVELPAQMEVSIDRIPTRQEIRILLLNSDKRTRALISLLATSGLRIGEAAALRVGNLELLTNKIVLSSAKSKSRHIRTTFFGDETATFIREYLGPQQLENKAAWLFPKPNNPDVHSTGQCLYMDIYRMLKKTGLHGRIDPDSKRLQLHPHSLRKYFFSKLIGSGVDRGIAEFFMGHKFGLDNAYLRMNDDELRAKYMLSVEDFTFLRDMKAEKLREEQFKERMKQESAEIQALRKKLEEDRIERDAMKATLITLQAQNEANTIQLRELSGANKVAVEKRV
jgi:integrase